MRTFSTLILGALLAMAAGPARAESACQLKMVTSAKLTMDPGGALAVDVTLNDDPVRMVVDTGGSISGITAGAAKRLGLETGDLGRQLNGGEIWGLDGRPMDTWVKVPRLGLGRSVSRDVRLLEFPMTADGSNGSFAGTFGADYLKNYDVELDIAGGKLALYEQDHCPGKVVYWANDYYMLPFSGRDGKINIDVELDGHAVRAMLDTGAFGTLLNTSTARQVFDLSNDSPGVEPADEVRGIDSRAEPSFRYQFKSLKLGNIEVGHPRIQIASMRAPRRIEVGSNIPTGPRCGEHADRHQCDPQPAPVHRL